VNISTEVRTSNKVDDLLGVTVPDEVQMRFWNLRSDHLEGREKDVAALAFRDGSDSNDGRMLKLRGGNRTPPKRTYDAITNDA